MDLGLRGKTAVISGGTKGIGSGIAEVLAEEGCNLVLVHRSDPGRAADFARELVDKNGVGVLRIHADVTDASLIDDIFDSANKRFGQTDILINNAAGGGVQKPLDEMTIDEWNDAMKGCLSHVFTMSSRFIRDCRRDKRGGHIVNVLAKAAITTNSHNNTSYIAAKGGMTSMTRSMANDLIDDGIYVNGIVPGYVLNNSGYQPGLPAYIAKEKFLRVGWATPRDMGNVAAFLCSSRARQVIGAIVDCSGGTML